MKNRELNIFMFSLIPIIIFTLILFWNKIVWLRFLALWYGFCLWVAFYILLEMKNGGLKDER